MHHAGTYHRHAVHMPGAHHVQVLEELAERDLSEVIPHLVGQIEAWRRRTAAQARLRCAAQAWRCRRAYRAALRAVCVLQHARRSRAVRVAYQGQRLLWLERRRCVRAVVELRRRVGGAEEVTCGRHTYEDADT